MTRIPVDLLAYIFVTAMVLTAVVNRYAPGETAAGDCRVGYVYDGDSVELICADGARTARLIGLDAPELKARCPAEKTAAEAAKRALADLVKAAKAVKVAQEGQDKYGRDLIRLWLDGRNAADLMVKAGHARTYSGGARESWCD